MTGPSQITNTSSTNNNTPRTQGIFSQAETEKVKNLSREQGRRRTISNKQDISDEEREKKVDDRNKSTTAVATVVKEETSSLAAMSLLLRKTNRVKLHVYDLVTNDTQLDVFGYYFPIGRCFNALNSSLHSLGTGAYHVGVEINGVEYAYGANSTKGLTGVFTCMPKHSPGYQYKTTIDFGHRYSTKQQSSASRGQSKMDVSNQFSAVAIDGREVVRSMAGDYMGTEYDLLRKNCCTFAYDACIRLGVSEEEIPSWFFNLASAGAATQDAANSTFAPFTQIFTACELNKFGEYLKDNEDGFEVIKGDTDCGGGGENGRGDQIVDRKPKYFS